MRTIKNLFYYFLLFCRPTVVSFGRFLGGILTFAGIGGLIILPKSWWFDIILVLMGFLLFVFRQKYDGLIFRFCPPGHHVTLPIV